MPSFYRPRVVRISGQHAINAKVTGFHVMPEFHVFTYKAEMLEDTKREFGRDSKAHAAQYLSVIEAAAKAAGVTYEVASSIHDHPYEAIIEVAENVGAISLSWRHMAGGGCRRFCSAARLRRY